MGPFGLTTLVAQRYYDLNGVTAGSGVTNNSTTTWSTTTGNWSTNSGGTVATGNWTNGQSAIFSAGTDAATFNYTVNLGANLTLSGLTLNDGNLTIGMGTNRTLGLSATSTFTVDANRSLTLTGSAATPQLLLGANRRLTTNVSGNLIISSGISGTGSSGITKTGTGTLTLSGNNTFTGTGNVNAGVLNIQHANALGSTSNGTFVLNNAALQVQGNISVGAEALTINGTGVGGTGALRSVSGNNTWGGTIALSGNAQITSDSGSSLTLTNTISGANRALTLNAVGDMTVSGNIGTTGRNLTKTGTGTLTLNGTSSFTGSTVVSAGVLNVQSAGALGNTVNGTFVQDGATLQLQGGITVSGEALTINGTGVGGSGSLRNISGDNAWNRTVTLAANSLITSDAGTLTLNNTTSVNGTNRALTLGGSGNITISGTIATGTGNLTKTGTGTATLSGSNTFSGGVILQEGTLRATTSANALGAGTLTLGGGTLQLANDTGLNFARNTSVTANSTIISDRLTNGAGVTHTLGTLSIGAQTLNVTAGSSVTSGTAGVAFGATTTSGNATFNVGSNALLTLGSFSDGGSADSITKTGTGNLTINGAGSTVNGTALLVSAGTVNLNGAGALGTLTAVTVNSGASLSLGAAQTLGSLAGSGSVSLGTSNLTVGSSNNLSSTFSGSISGTGNVIKAGTGTLTLSGSSSYSGTTNITAGTLAATSANAMGTGNVTVGPAGTLQLSTSSVNVANNVTLAGGTVQSVSGNMTQLGGNLVLTASSNIISSTAGQNLIIGNFNSPSPTTTNIDLGSNNLTLSGAGNIEFWGNVGVSGNTGGLISNSTGTIRLYGYTSYYTGDTVINSGNLIIDTDPNSIFNNQAIRGNLTIGDGVNAALVRYANGNLDNKIADNSTITINYGSRLDLNDAFDYVGALNLTGANITTGSGGTLFLNGNVTVNAANITTTISGYQFAMGPTDSVNRTFTVADGSAASDLTINSQVAFGALYKLGDGTMTLTGENIYGGVTTVADGVLNIQHAKALGATVNGTVVLAGAELQMQGGIAVTGETLNLSGNGVSGGGALRSVSGNNSWSGPISLAAASRIGSESAGQTLTINGTITGSNQNLSVGGVGDTFLHGAIGTGTGTLTKDGTGTVTITASNTYQGVTTINEGVVNIRNDFALGSTAGNVIVANGAALQIQQDAAYNGGNAIRVGAENLALSGTGIGNTGALRNISGDNRWGGNVTVNTANVRINSDSGTLNLTGSGTSITMGNNTLTVGGSGNTRIGSQLIAGTAGQLTKDGTGTLTLSGNNTTTFTGDVTVSTGTLATGANNALNNSSIDLLIDSAGTVDLVQYAQSIGTLAGTGALAFGSGGSLTLNESSTFSGSFSGTGEIIVAANKTLTLGADFNAAGVTIKLLNGATLAVNGSTSTFAGLTLLGNSTIDFDDTANSIITFTNLSLGSYTLAVDGWVDTQDYFYVTNQPGTKGSPPLNQVTFGPSGGPPWTGANTTWLPFDTQVTPVPEPSTYGAMLMAGGLALFGFRRWRQSKRAA